MAVEPAAEEPQGTPYPQDRFVLLLIILVLLVALFGIAQHLPGPEAEGPQFSEDILQGDMAIKIAYASERWQEILPPSQRRQMEILRDRQHLSAIDSYEQIVRDDPSLQNLRRLLIIEYPRKRAAVIAKLAARGKNLQAEVAMWKAIYVSKKPLSPQESARYSSMIRRLDLGWYQSLALADLYARAGSAKEAIAERDLAVASAVRAMTLLAVLLAVLGSLGLFGIFVITWYVSAERMRRIPDRAPPDNQGLVAGYFLEAFIAYLGIVIGTQVLAGVALLSVKNPLSPRTMVFATAGVYTLGGVLAAIYLAYRLRAAGWSWKSVGLTSRNPLLDVGWGIMGYAAALPLLLVASLLSQTLTKYIPTPSNPVVPIFLQANSLLERLVILGLTVIVAAFFEELFFRGVLFHSFQAKWGVRLGLVLSAAVFASVHPLPLGFLPIFVLGYVLATLLYRRGSLLPCMVTHGLNNCVAFLVLSILVGSP